jgi:hypothetical protein
LGASHGEAALVAALRRSVAFKRFRAADVRSILAAGAGTAQPRPPNHARPTTPAQPRPPGDALVPSLLSSPTRSLQAYPTISTTITTTEGTATS